MSLSIGRFLLILLNLFRSLQPDFVNRWNGKRLMHRFPSEFQILHYVRIFAHIAKSNGGPW